MIELFEKAGSNMDRICVLLIQWHITSRCSNVCRHCYMYDPATYESEQKHENDLFGLLTILKSIEEFEHRWNVNVFFSISGGDPLMHPDWYPFLKELKSRNRVFSILGNPEHLYSENINKLKDLGISHYHMSIDGLEDVHDSFRSEGSFRRTMKAVDVLRDCGIPTSLGFTLYPENKDQLIPLLRYLGTKTTVGGFCFEFGACTGNATSLSGDFSSNEIKDLFIGYLSEKERLRNDGYRINACELPSIMKLARFEQSTLYPFLPDEVPVVSGCSAGWLFVPILSDGTVLACRRFPVKVGKLPEQSFEEIFLGSTELKKFRRNQFFTGCGTCWFYKYCRGCPAYVHGITKDPFSVNPVCFMNLLSRKIPESLPMLNPIPLETTFKEEYSLVASHFYNIYISRYDAFMRSISVQRLLLILTQGKRSERINFLLDPDDYLAQKDLILSDLEKLFVCRYLGVIE